MVTSCMPVSGDFYPRSPCGERHDGAQQRQRILPHFYPRSPCGERLLRVAVFEHAVVISIHALLAESDKLPACDGLTNTVFLSTLSLRRATIDCGLAIIDTIFLSTLSLRRATLPVRSARHVLANFYPRSPCGERRWAPRTPGPNLYFYPRSPCGERRISGPRTCKGKLFLSTLSLRRATYDAELYTPYALISIHALLAESDRPRCYDYRPHLDFYPRSPCGERHAIKWLGYSELDFYPRSPCGERLDEIPYQRQIDQFLSTLSLRRATSE